MAAECGFGSRAGVDRLDPAVEALALQPTTDRRVSIAKLHGSCLVFKKALAALALTLRMARVRYHSRAINYIARARRRNSRAILRRAAHRSLRLYPAQRGPRLLRPRRLGAFRWFRT